VTLAVDLGYKAAVSDNMYAWRAGAQSWKCGLINHFTNAFSCMLESFYIMHRQALRQAKHNLGMVDVTILQA
jgi:hypothetical protein